MDDIIINDYLGGFLACEFLIKKGCTQIGFIGDIEKSENFKHRYHGYKQCVKKYLDLKTNEMICLTNGIEEAVLHNNYRYVQKMLLTYRKMPQAFICVNDRNAAIIMKALQYNGYKVPNDIMLISFDNMELSDNQFTTLEVSRAIIAKRAIRRIYEMIHEKTNPETVMLAPNIIERGSTKETNKTDL